ncbi:MAG: hypothetical protein RLP09_17865 [Sandaracinaceae bacterium]|nr:MAG: hypothetical protein EVA89_32580 [Sandaracinaceae bacterium]
MVRRLLFALTAFGLLVIAAPASTRADTGHVGMLGGVAVVDESGETQWRPHARTEIGFRLWGPFELGGFLQLTTLGFPMEMASFGGGLFVQLRPDTALFGFVPYLEGSGSRVTLPVADGRVDAWGVSAGGGLGYEVGAGVVIEARVLHHWYFDLPGNGPSGTGEVGVDGWSLTAGVTYRMP